jgi:hypothetical protein
LVAHAVVVACSSRLSRDGILCASGVTCPPVVDRLTNNQIKFAPPPIQPEAGVRAGTLHPHYNYFVQIIGWKKILKFLFTL